jgi:hypothetical protein
MKLKMSSSVLIGFVVLAIVVMIFITRQERERFDVNPAVAAELAPLNIRLSNIQKKQEKVQDVVNAGAGKASMDGIGV